MVIVHDSYRCTPIISTEGKLPSPGVYYSKVIDSYTTIINPFYKDEDTCFIIKYKLVNVKTLEESIFVESYYPYRVTHRTKKFFDYLNKHFPYVNEDEAYVGTLEKLKIDFDVIGGIVYPVVTHRQFIDYSDFYKKNYLVDEEDEV